MAKCGVCGTEFPTCYMDTVSSCPKCKTTFWNDSPRYLSNKATSSADESDINKNKSKRR